MCMFYFEILVYKWHPCMLMFMTGTKNDTIHKQSCARIDFRRQTYSHLHYLQFLPDALDE